jgi:hypothetical protein
MRCHHLLVHISNVTYPLPSSLVTIGWGSNLPRPRGPILQGGNEAGHVVVAICAGSMLVQGAFPGYCDFKYSYKLLYLLFFLDSPWDTLSLPISERSGLTRFLIMETASKVWKDHVLNAQVGFTPGKH